MTPKKWQQLDRLFHSALDRDPKERAAFLEQACGGDEELRREVESLLATDAETASVAALPAQVAAKMLTEHQAPPMLGRVIGHYRILSLLGRGGMGEVYLAQDTSLDRKVALKFLSAAMEQDPVARKRFLREAKAAAAPDHPFICKVYQTGEVEGRAFIAMEYVEGQTLKQALAEGPLVLGEILRAATEMAEALALAHKRGIIHRDLKPANVMLTEQGHAKVMDFGLAKQVAPIAGVQSQEQSLSTNLTGEGVTLGTLAYMSPEQVRGQGVDARSDIFSFGIALYELVTGVHPFQKPAPLATANAILNEMPAPLSRPTEEVPQRLQQIVSRMLAKNPEERYPSIREVEADLNECRATSSVPAVAPDQMKALRQALGRPQIALAVALILVVALGLGFWLFSRNAKVRWAREQAIPEITRLIQEDQYTAAVALAREAEKYIPADPIPSQLWPEMSREFSITTTPPGAGVYVREYAAVDREWESLGQTPIERLRLPLEFVRWKIEKAGFNTVEGAAYTSALAASPSELGKLSFTLDKEGSIPPGMVRVAGGRVTPFVSNLYFGGVSIFTQGSSERLPQYADFLIKSGRALLIPVFKGAYERRDGFMMIPPFTTAAFRDHMIQWSKDLGRSIDYLESRPEIARDKLGYYGVSAGTAIGSTLLALEKRFKVSVFLAGGLGLHQLDPQADPFNFAPHVRIPVLMINGRYDQVFPFETSQQPLFHLLGTSETRCSSFYLGRMV